MREQKKIKYVALLHNNKEMLNKPGSGKSMKIGISDNSPIQGTDFYYVRVVQEDDHIAWSSPIWVSVQ